MREDYTTENIIWYCVYGGGAGFRPKSCPKCHHHVYNNSTNTVSMLSYTNTRILKDVFYFQFFISALSFATFAVSPELPQNRLQLSFTLLLTSVAFKFVINQSLPKISYLTYMVSLISVQWASMTRVELLPMLLFAWFIHRLIWVHWSFVCEDTCLLKPLMLHLHSRAFILQKRWSKWSFCCFACQSACVSIRFFHKWKITVPYHLNIPKGIKSNSVPFMEKSDWQAGKIIISKNL